VTSAAPTVVTLQTNSAWIVILAVSLVTLVAALILRRIIGRPGGMHSGLLLMLPLVLPLAAAVVYQTGALPEVSLLRPAGQVFLEGSESLFKLVRVADGSGTSTLYALTGSPGTWLVLIGLAVTSFMLIRRAVGLALVRRLVRRCAPLDNAGVDEMVATLSARVGLRQVPAVLLLPEGISGAFVTGSKPGNILVSQDLTEELEEDELEGILAHEVAHLRTRDVAVVCTAGFLRDLIAWNPLGHIAFRRLYVDREYEADRRAAALTGAPLSVASGLLKAVEISRSRRGPVQRVILAAVRPGVLVSRRVDGLIAMADGRASVTAAGYLPFLAAGLIVALLGLNVGARLAGEESGLMIALGATSHEAEVWSVPERAAGSKAPVKDAKKSSNNSVKRSARAARSERGADLTRPVRLLGLKDGLRIREADLDIWMKIVGKRVEQSGVPRITLRWEARYQYRAVPLLSAERRIPIGIYRLRREI
jgi:Zn-dependent protease with chaperone function